MAKRREATPERLTELRNALGIAQFELAMAKGELYLHTGDGKLFEQDFELAREACLRAFDKVRDIQKEIDWVERALLKLPELPFEKEE